VSEARTGKRFPLQLTTTIRGAKLAGSKASKLQGKTADLSAAGVFIQADGDFEVGSNIEFDITLPAEVIGSGQDVEIRCQGRVVRSADPKARRQRDKGKGGVACVIDQYEFVRKK
jgi:PilZ domain